MWSRIEGAKEKLCVCMFTERYYCRGKGRRVCESCKRKIPRMSKFERNRTDRNQRPRTPGWYESEGGSSRGFEVRGATIGVSQEDTIIRRSGSRTDISQQRRAGARSWPSREVEAENRRYLNEKSSDGSGNYYTVRRNVGSVGGGRRRRLFTRGREGIQVRPRRMSGRRWKERRWESTVPLEM